MSRIRNAFLLTLGCAFNIAATNAQATCSPSVEITVSRILRDAKNNLTFENENPRKRLVIPRGHGLDEQMICLQHQRNKKADQALIVLLDYYIGEGPKGILMFRIAERGKPTIPLLNAIKGTPVTCPFKPEDMCETSEQHRAARDDMSESILRNIPKRRGEAWRN